MAIIFGTSQDDVLTGTLFSDQLVGLAGNDTLSGSGLDDLLIGGTGNDSLQGGEGDDILLDRAGDDSLEGGAGNDTFRIVANGNDTVDGGDGNDTLYINFSGSTANITQTVLTPQGESGVFSDDAGNSVTYLSDPQGIDIILTSGSGNDFIIGSTGNDVFNGGSGDDSIGGGEGNDVVVGGEGNDQLSGVLQSTGLRTTFGIDTVDTLTGGAGNDTFNFVGVESIGVFTLYNDFDNATPGFEDYALITDFNTADDQIVLVGSPSDYVLGASPLSGVSGTAIYLNTDGTDGVGPTDELVAVVQGSTGLDLSASYITYVPPGF
jgi:Ca2+-binding RTX toxin-like protein